MLNRFLCCRNATGRFVTHLDACFLFPCFDSLAHDEGSLRSSIHSDLTGRGLDEVATCSHREDRCFPDILCTLEQTGLEDHFEVFVSANGFELADLVEALLIVTLQELTDAQYDVYLRCARFESHCGLCHFDLQESLRSRETTAHASDIELRIFQRLAHILRHSGIHTDCGYVGDTREFLLEGVHSVGHLLHFGDGVVRTQRGIVNLMQTLFPNLYVIILRKMFCFDVSHLSFYLLVCKWAGILRK